MEPKEITTLEILEEGLPGEIQGKVYEDDGELWEKLDKLNLSDLQIVRNDQGYAVWREMPGPFHNAAVEEIEQLFRAWKGEQILRGTKQADVPTLQALPRFRHLGSRPIGSTWTDSLEHQAPKEGQPSRNYPVQLGQHS
jgi:hypothetical protein